MRLTEINFLGPLQIRFSAPHTYLRLMPKFEYPPTVNPCLRALSGFTKLNLTDTAYVSSATATACG
jgi:hypothetical protein